MMFVLASNSPRRKQLMNELGLPFRIAPAQIDERFQPGEAPVDYVQRMAQAKADSVSSFLPTDTFLLAADTVVVDHDQVLGKPVDAANASQMLTQLRGKEHQVLSALVVISLIDGKRYGEVCTTSVRMRSYSDAEIETYITSGDPFDKAGAYAIQHSGFHPVEKIRGCYTNVVGLPICCLVQLLRESGASFETKMNSSCFVHRPGFPDQTLECSFNPKNK
jgi:septum formation protein